jgi:topoisomerase-4 subunit A
LSKHTIKKITFKTAGASTLGGLDLWYDESVGRLNTNEHGRFLGKFLPEDNVLVIYKNGNYELTNFDLTNRYEPEQILLLEKFKKEKIISCAYLNGIFGTLYIKRFLIETTTLNKPFLFITEEAGSELFAVSTESNLQIEILTQENKKSAVETIIYDLEVMTEVRGWKTQGTKIATKAIKKVRFLSNSRENSGVQASLFA